MMHFIVFSAFSAGKIGLFTLEDLCLWCMRFRAFPPAFDKLGEIYQ